MPPKSRSSKRTPPNSSTRQLSYLAPQISPPVHLQQDIRSGPPIAMSVETQTVLRRPFSPQSPYESVRLPPLQSQFPALQTNRPLPSSRALESNLTQRSVFTAAQSSPYGPIEPQSRVSPIVASGHSSPVSTGSRGVKRSHEEATGGILTKPVQFTPPPLSRAPLPIRTDFSDPFMRGVPFPPALEPGQISSVSTPSGTTSSFPPFGSGPNAAYSRRQSQSSSTLSNTSRCSLHIRQQPRAARAGPDGRDRRALDPPPIIQLLMNDFDPDNPADVTELKQSFFVVHCRLISARDERDVSTQPKFTEDGVRETQRLLLGTMVASPFHCNDDPDPATAATHPISRTKEPPPPDAPPSPSARFMPISRARKSSPTPTTATPTTAEEATTTTKPTTTKPPQDPSKLPTTFFIFADLSVRKAGHYHLEFSLMKMDPLALLNPGGTVPIISSVRSSVFRVVNAKDFDQVHPSSRLVRGLLQRGAGFPLKLKKGIREGQRKKGKLGRGGSGEDGEDGNEDVDMMSDDDYDAEEEIPLPGDDIEDNDEQSPRRRQRRPIETIEDDDTRETKQADETLPDLDTQRRQSRESNNETANDVEDRPAMKG